MPPGFGSNEFVRRIDAHHLAGFLCDDGMHRQPFLRGQFNDIRQIILACGVIVIDLRQGNFQKCSRYTVDADIDFLNGNLFGRAVLEFDDSGNRIVLISDDATISSRFIEVDGQADELILCSL